MIGYTGLSNQMDPEGELLFEKAEILTYIEGCLYKL
jgi:hypothetical protein